jgi:hypothetical protein
MSFAKRQMEREDERRNIAMSILVDVHAVSKCKEDDDYVDQLDPEALKAAYMKAASMIKRRDPKVALFKSQRHLTNTIKAVYADTPATCHHEDVMSND